jgi:hypothetical protein
MAINTDKGEFSTLIAAILAADPAVLKALNGNGQGDLKNSIKDLNMRLNFL